MSEQNKAIARNFLETAWGKKDIQGIEKYVAADHVNHGPFTDQMPAGVEGDKAFVSTFLNAFPDVRMTIDQQEDEGDLVRTWVTYTATQTGQLMDIPATGNQAVVPVFITDRGRRAHVLLTIEEYNRLAGKGMSVLESLAQPGGPEYDFDVEFPRSRELARSFDFDLD